VVHDHLVLAETMMTPKANVISTKVVDAVADSADLTGGVLGSRLSIEMKEADKVVLSAITAKTLKTTEALHVKTFSIAPRRVHAALAAITR
jgi:2-keto-4-pentenoate hydratase